jgi:hypothetical protein
VFLFCSKVKKTGLKIVIVYRLLSINKTLGKIIASYLRF